MACSCNGLSFVLRSAVALVDACRLSKFDRTGIRLAGDEHDDDGVEWSDALGEFSGAIVIGLQGVVHVIIGGACVQNELWKWLRFIFIRFAVQLQREDCVNGEERKQLFKVHFDSMANVMVCPTGWMDEWKW